MAEYVSAVCEAFRVMAESRQPTEEEVREIRARAVRGFFGSDIRAVDVIDDRELVVLLCDSWLAQRDVVAAAQRVLDDGVETEDGLLLANPENVLKLRDAVAAVVSGTPEED